MISVAGSLPDRFALPPAACCSTGREAGARDGRRNLIRQALAAGLVDELTIIIAPVTLGAGERLFEGFGESLELEHLGLRQSPFATFIGYRVKNESGES